MVQKERRKCERIGSINLLNYVCLGEDNQFVKQGMGRTLNVSESGILLETHMPIDIRYVVSLTIGFEGELMDIRGKVTHVRKKGPAQFETGIKFFATDESELRVLRKYIRRFKGLTP